MFTMLIIYAYSKPVHAAGRELDMIASASRAREHTSLPQAGHLRCVRGLATCNLFPLLALDSRLEALRSLHSQSAMVSTGRQTLDERCPAVGSGNVCH